MGKMRAFRVLTSSHVEGTVGNEKSYEKGSVVETETDLVALFGKDKFEEVTPGQEAYRMTTPVAKPQETVDLDAEDKSAAKGKKAKEKEGEEDETRDVTEIESSLGENVTDGFPLASDNDLIVLKNGREYFVADADAPNDAISKDKELKSKKAVEEFVEAHLK